MLINDLYDIKEIKKEDSHIKASIFIHKENEIFKGHFPDNPIMPGVCMIQIIKELLEKALNKKLFLQKAVNVKFMALIVPNKTPNLDFDISIIKNERVFKIKTTTQFGSTIALKFSGEFKEIN